MKAIIIRWLFSYRFFKPHCTAPSSGEQKVGGFFLSGFEKKTLTISKIIFTQEIVMLSLKISNLK